MLGAGITLAWAAIAFGFAHIVGENCIICALLVLFGPLFPIAGLWDTNPFLHDLPTLWLPIFSAIVWFAVGSLIGAFVGYAKSRKT